MEKPALKKTATKSPVKKTSTLKFKRSIRFKAEPMTLGYLDLEPAKTFKPQLVGIVLNESYTGCAVILASDDKLNNKQQLKIKVGNLEPINASIIWVKTLDENIHKVGIKFLE